MWVFYIFILFGTGAMLLSIPIGTKLSSIHKKSLGQFAMDPQLMTFVIRAVGGIMTVIGILVLLIA